MRLRIDLAYDGADFHGWAAQPGLRTVQGELQAALATVLRRLAVGGAAPAAPTPVSTPAARSCTSTSSRGARRAADGTTGPVPALARTARRAAARRSARTPRGRRARRLRRPLLAAVAALRLPGDRPARVADPLTRGHVLAWPRPLDVAAMNAASATCSGCHDFASFCKQREGATTVRTLLDLCWARERTTCSSAHRPGRRLLPPHGALARRLPARGRRGPSAGRVGRRGPGRRGPRPRRDRRTAARADAGGGRLPARRRPRRPAAETRGRRRG